ncbi:MAG: hypothetical protein ACI857_002418 [Arenicella sp.]|jgi:hypothetical protein
MTMSLKISFQLLICLTLINRSTLAQATIDSSIDTANANYFIRVSNWVPFNAYSLGQTSSKDSLEFSAMPINWASGIAFGKSDSNFLRISLIANWRIEYKIKSDVNSFSMQRIGLGVMFDYSEIIYFGVVYPLETPNFKIRNPQLLVGVQVSLKELRNSN